MGHLTSRQYVQRSFSSQMLSPDLPMGQAVFGVPIQSKQSCSISSAPPICPQTYKALSASCADIPIPPTVPISPRSAIVLAQERKARRNLPLPHQKQNDNPPAAVNHTT